MPPPQRLHTASDIAGATQTPRRFDLLDAEVVMYERVLEAPEAERLFAALRAELPWRQDVIRVCGRECSIPRLQSWHGEPGARYAYSGLALEPLAWTPALLEARALVERVSKARFDSVLANLYRDGRDSNGWHADDEPELGARPLIASLSLGATRRFRLRHRAGRAAPLSIELESGSLLKMSGDTQHAWQHSLPKTNAAVGERVNLTFRRVLAATRAAECEGCELR